MLQVEFINAGHGNLISAHRVIAIVDTKSNPLKRLIDDAEEQGKLINISHGRKWRSAIIFDSNHVVLSSISPETLGGRMDSVRQELEERNLIAKKAAPESDE